MSSLVINSFTGGGGFSTDGALLRVVAPTGSTVTATRTGSISKTPDGSLILGSTGKTCYYFSFAQSEYSATPWTISAVKSSDSTSDTVVINAAGEYTIELFYWNGELYLNGNQYTEYTGGWITKRVKGRDKVDGQWAIEPYEPTLDTSGNTMVVTMTSEGTANRSGSVITTNKIDLAGNGFRSLTLIGTKSTRNPVAFYVTSTDTAAGGIISPDVTSGDIYDEGAVELTLDISGLTQSVYVGADVSKYSAGTNTLTITSIIASTQSA